MQNIAQLTNPAEISLSFASDDLPAWQRYMVESIESITGKQRLQQAWDHFCTNDAGTEHFWQIVIDSLRLSIRTYGNTLEAIPATGPVLIVANHPFGLVDGAAIAWLLAQRRKDFKVILWDVFDRLASGRDYFLPMDLTENSLSSRRQNLSVYRQSVQLLDSGGAVIVFPAGSVERTRHPLARPEELIWHPFTEKIALGSGAPVLPLFVSGHNSWLFHAASCISETLRLSLFFREINRKLGSSVDVTIGRPIAPELIRHWKDSDVVMRRLKEATLDLEAVFHQRINESLQHD
ncbi:MAG: 1-acyl-sn-glycerol-3-phosphate acyltransferase [Gammaproteobacteria bacterium]|nr:1-acyl-sn-glycerol-3-phosphate acyltransferase [Gammaproteobacteria bacterium]